MTNTIHLKKVIFTALFVALAVLYFTVDVQAYTKTNKKDTSKDLCLVDGCKETRKQSSMYCYSHACWKSSCKKKRVEGGHYCIDHTCYNKGCNNGVGSANEKCSFCKDKAKKAEAEKKNTSSSTAKQSTTKKITTKSKTYKKSTSKSTSSYKKKVTMPDCDDYDSYEDFMDDWDGYMPDGSDAEDYWENW